MGLVTTITQDPMGEALREASCTRIACMDVRSVLASQLLHLGARRFDEAKERSAQLNEALEDVSSKLKQAMKRLEAMNRYFWLKAAELADNVEALTLLSTLHENRKLPLTGIGLNAEGRAIALAQLAGAHLCEVSDREVWITAQGEDFYQRLGKHSGGPGS